MNNPYPTPYELRVERDADRLLREQAADVAIWRKALAELTRVVDTRDFPLGSPCEHFDLKHISDLLGDLAIGADDDEDLAMDLAREAA